MNFCIYYNKQSKFNNKLVNHHEISEVFSILENITEEELIEVNKSFLGRTKSISKALSIIISEKFRQSHWEENKLIFERSEKEFAKKRWSIDLYKKRTSVEVAFNHEEGSCWNILKGLLANKSNKFMKNISIDYSVIITVCNELRSTGGFDSSVGTYENYINYLNAFEEILDYPIILIGLSRIENFTIKHNRVLNKKIARIEKRG